MKNIQLADNWWLHEFRCRCEERGHKFCGGAAPIQERLVTLLQRTRDFACSPLQCVSPGAPAGSGFRCIPYNLLVGGTPESFHTRGMAADIWSLTMRASQVAECAEKAIAELGYGFMLVYEAKGFVHLDIRN